MKKKRINRHGQQCGGVGGREWVEVEEGIRWINSNRKKLQIKNNSIYISMPKMKYVDINVTKYVQNLHEEKCKVLMTKIKELNKQRDILCS